ncbi:hypothetical protein HUA74_38620 [Myxococcus sp. CA051A]|uniref:hypothetical protein n=1 Tax=unclassified Myxococcus TaxID=2648731 RepID=UPI00157B11D3|nr:MULTISPECIES: hypothetical protein [unclassified Myxococcus]NTX17425.1 hypothetical protein [Myxococcus sp. CA056]NTX39004.1 hypothetical protein [Myxococcus sp. CA033]NTX57522.1 hypothetical protein [Myxococcus sp. CA039A]NTX66580.1 hypothetical protein [Myxococcus sp. CA051A]
MTTRLERGFWKWGLLSLALAGCGGVLGDEAGDEPLLTLEGTLQSSASFDLGNSNSDRLRAALLWNTWPKVVVDCLVQQTYPEGISKCARLSPRSSFHHPGVDVKVNGRFPNSFSMPLNRLPEPGALMGEEGSRLGMAYVMAYVDGNGNGKLDRVPTEALSSPDIVVGFQEGFDGEQTESSFIMFREGALHPLFHLDFPNCPEIPQGYSVVTMRYTPTSEECFVTTRKVDVNVVLKASQALQQMACELPNASVLVDSVRASTMGPPPPGSTQRCGTYIRPVSRLDQVLLVNPHPERFCTAANTVAYTLRDYWDGAWDDRASPPAWWPCPVTAP